MKRSTLFYALLAMALSGRPALAVLVAYEGFDYDQAGAVAGNNGGSGWVSPWGNNTTSPNVNANLTNDNVSITSPPNPFSPLGDRIAKVGAVGTGFSTINRFFSAAGTGFNMGTDGTLYLSFSWTKTDGGSSGDNLEFTLHDSTLGNTFAARAGVTSSDAHFLTQGNTVAAGDQYGAIAQSTKYFTVLKITASSGAGVDQVQATNFTSLPPASEPGTWDKTVALTLADAVNINQFRLTMGQNTRAQFDELRIGTTWNDVAVAVPEAGAAAFVLLAATAVGCRRLFK